MKKNKILISAVLLFVHYNNYGILSEQLLINHIKNSIEKAQKGVSKLNSDILTIPGMSSHKVRHFLNNLCSLENAHYLEIGVWQGSTFISALHQNTDTLASAIAIDNWSEFNGPKNNFLSNTAKFLPKKTFLFVDHDCFTVDTQVFSNKVDIYFYDGNHSTESQKNAFIYFNDILADTFITVVDDWNAPEAPQGTKEAFKQLNYEVVYEVALPARFNGDTENWWNGLYVALIRKK